MDKPRCSKCKHYFITWDRIRPYGCRAFGFKTRVIPCVVVRESSGRECVLFEPREGKRGSKD